MDMEPSQKTWPRLPEGIYIENSFLAIYERTTSMYSVTMTTGLLQSPCFYGVEHFSSLRKGSCIYQPCNNTEVQQNWLKLVVFQMFIFHQGNHGDNITDWYGALLSRSIPRANTITDCMLYKRVCFVLRGWLIYKQGEIRCWIKQLQR